MKPEELRQVERAHRVDRQARRPALGPLAGGFHERREQRVRTVRTALELRVRLRRDVERVVGQLDVLDEQAVG